MLTALPDWNGRLRHRSFRRALCDGARRHRLQASEQPVRKTLEEQRNRLHTRLTGTQRWVGAEAQRPSAQPLLGPTVSAACAFRSPRGAGCSVVVSRRVCRSAWALTTAPNNMVNDVM
jgi:hypothetical protein